MKNDKSKRHSPAKATSGGGAAKNNSNVSKSGGASAKSHSGLGKSGGGAKNRSYVGRSGKPKGTEGTLNEIILGKIDGTNKGYGFLQLEDKSGGDLFVAASEMNGAMHGDSVKAVIISRRKGAGEARVLEILERGTSKLVGTFNLSKTDSGNGFVVPDDSRHNRDIHINKAVSANAMPGEKVVVKIVDFPPNRMAEGEITEVLGMPNDAGVDILSIIRSYNLYEEFPKRVLQEAAQAPTCVVKEDLAKRKDFTNDCVITIDGDDSRDFDDAVCVTKKGNNYVLSVHIADVAHYVRANTKLDTEAFKRGTSVYFCDRVLPMLPVELSNGICSLNEGVQRLTLSIIMEIDSLGSVVNHKLYEGIIVSRARMTYTNVTKILDGDKQLTKQYEPIVPMLKDMLALQKILFNKRDERGNIEFDIAESKIELDDKGKTLNITKYPRLVAHRIIEEFMLLANETIAERFCGLKTPFVYRSHLNPPTEKVDGLLTFLAALGINFGENTTNPQSKDFSNLLKNVDPKLSNVVSRVALRSMTKASYEPANNGHFGLAAPFYCHFTSPIRRYPDLMIHRIIKEYINGGAAATVKYTAIVAEAAKLSSERERLSEQAERKVNDLKKAEFMADKIGEIYDGIISGVTEWGVFVELENTCEGLVRTENLKAGSYQFNPQLHSLSSGSFNYKLGDSIKIVVDSVVEDKVNFKLSV